MDPDDGTLEVVEKSVTEISRSSSLRELFVACRQMPLTAFSYYIVSFSAKRGIPIRRMLSRRGPFPAGSPELEFMNDLDQTIATGLRVAVLIIYPDDPTVVG